MEKQIEYVILDNVNLFLERLLFRKLDWENIWLQVEEIFERQAEETCV